MRSVHRDVALSAIASHAPEHSILKSGGITNVPVPWANAPRGAGHTLPFASQQVVWHHWLQTVPGVWARSGSARKIDIAARKLEV